MNHRFSLLCCLLLGTCIAANAQEWPQWGQNPQHTGVSIAVGQQVRHILADVVYDPFVEKEKVEYGGDLDVHYQAPITEGDDVYMEFKTGQFTDLPHWNTQIWNERRLRWEDGRFTTAWSFASDWKPVPFSDSGHGPGWEPVFHAALSGRYIYVPGFGGSIYKLRKTGGQVVAHIQPFGSPVDANTFTVGPLTADGSGNIYYNVIKLASSDTPWDDDVVNSWLVKVGANGHVLKASYASLTPGAPTGDQCLGIFDPADFPWPPSPDAVPPNVPCGAQRPSPNAAPAVAPDGTIYTVSVAHLAARTAYLLAVNPDLTPRWQASLRDRLHDGCNVLLPPNGVPGGCRAGAHTGVDPAQNRPGAGRILDDATSSPVVAPDGSIFFGADSRFNYGQGHLMKFSSSGVFLAAYPFGWDDTPALFAHGGSYSIITKDNQYGDRGSYCNDDTFCPPDRTANNPSYPEGYFITWLDSNLVPRWRWQNTNPLSCTRDTLGHVTCVSDHPHGFEWCVNAPAIDRKGNVYANSEDGGVYVIKPNGKLRDSLFLQSALGAAYTPLSIKGDGLILTQNDGHLFVSGN